MADLLKGKRGLIMGVANERSIAWGIAAAMAAEGAELAFTYQGEAFGKRVGPLAASIGSQFLWMLTCQTTHRLIWLSVALPKNGANWTLWFMQLPFQIRTN